MKLAAAILASSMVATSFIAPAATVLEQHGNWFVVFNPIDISAGKIIYSAYSKAVKGGGKVWLECAYGYKNSWTFEYRPGKALPSSESTLYPIDLKVDDSRWQMSLFKRVGNALFIHDKKAGLEKLNQSIDGKALYFHTRKTGHFDIFSLRGFAAAAKKMFDMCKST